MSLARFLRASLIVAAIAAMSLTAGCAVKDPLPPPRPQGALIEHDAANGKTVHVQVGRQIVLILSSTYWNIRGSSAPAVVRQDGPPKVLPKPPGGCVPGGGCAPLRTVFTALAAGRAVITAHRTTCGEALMCSPSHRWFHLTLIVG